MLNKCRRVILCLVLLCVCSGCSLLFITPPRPPNDCTSHPAAYLVPVGGTAATLFAALGTAVMWESKGNGGYLMAALTALGAYSAGYGFVGISRCRQWKAETQGAMTWRRANQPGGVRAPPRRGPMTDQVDHRARPSSGVETPNILTAPAF